LLKKHKNIKKKVRKWCKNMKKVEKSAKTNVKIKNTNKKFFLTPGRVPKKAPPSHIAPVFIFSPEGYFGELF